MWSNAQAGRYYSSLRAASPARRLCLGLRGGIHPLNLKAQFMKTTRVVLTAVSLAVASLSALAGGPDRVASGSSNGYTWQAVSNIVGVTSTATIAGGGDPLYLPTFPAYSGVVGLLLNFGPAGSFVCSGSLLPDRQSILTAAHCVTSGPALTQPISTTAFFNDGSGLGADTVVYSAPVAGVTTVAGGQIFVNPGYTGQVIDQNDIAVIRLNAPAPAFAPSYQLYTGPLSGTDMNLAGYGARSNAGGNVGANLGTGRLRQGNNRYDMRFGDADFGNFFTAIDPVTGYRFFDNSDGTLPSALVDQSWVTDFDNGLAANDASCVLAATFNLGGAKYCNLGRGASEATVAGGDSGGPQFVGGKIASVTSYGLSFGNVAADGGGDLDGALNDTFGEFAGYVPVSIHVNFINSTLVPEPSTYALMALGLMGVGALVKRRQA